MPPRLLRRGGGRWECPAAGGGRCRLLRRMQEARARSRAAAASADLRAALAAAAAAIHGADALFVAAGAGMSADSGLPHFHGTDTERLWEAFPALRAKGLCLQARDDRSSEWERESREMIF